MVLGACRQQPVVPGLSPDRNGRHVVESHLWQYRVQVRCQLLGGGVVVAEQDHLLTCHDLGFNGLCHSRHFGMHSHTRAELLDTFKVILDNQLIRLGKERHVPPQFLPNVVEMPPANMEARIVGGLRLARAFLRQAKRTIHAHHKFQLFNGRRRDDNIPITSTAERSLFTGQVVNPMAHNEHPERVGRRLGLCNQSCRHDFRAAGSAPRIEIVERDC